MKRQRGRNRKPGGNQNNNSANPNRSWDSQGPENIKVRGNAQTVYERYQQLARDATSAGDRVLAENYLQHAEHYFRVLRALQPQRSFQEIAQREQIGQGFDIDFEDESGAQAAAFAAAQQAADRQAQQNQGGHGPAQANGQNGSQGSGQNDRSGQNASPHAGSASGQNDRPGDDNDSDGARRESRRERWERRRDSRRGPYEREDSEGGAGQSGDEPSQPTAVADESTGDAPAPRSRSRTRAQKLPAEAEAMSETTLPGFLTRATPSSSSEQPEEAAEDKPAPRRRAPRRKAEAPTDE
ncbi:MAG: DUF4167 domain-containing protein [Brevundimonas sp.]|uniref:DUF4167 domain-containing protein n=1 Tax=Brevundimonas sp. TaxID=1871086 RepID=UPI00391A8D4D